MMTYRADIDGLRAIAVLSVLAYHLNHTFLPGGFLGVDIFFVISGFLLSSIIINKLESNSFSMADFYKRRVKRILPAFFVAGIASIPLSFWLLLPDEFAQTLQTLFYTTFFGQNYFFAFGSVEYWTNGLQSKPLLHTWSLAVEEQFYILLPLTLIVLYALKLRAKSIAWILFFIATISFGVAHLWFEIPFLPDGFVKRFNYYSLTSRAGELLIGTLLAIFLIKRPLLLSSKICNTLSIFALTGIVACLILFSMSKILFPSIWAAIPTLFVGLLLLANTPAINGGGGGELLPKRLYTNC